MQKKKILKLMLLFTLSLVTASICIAAAQPGVIPGVPSERHHGDHYGGTQGGYQVGMQGDHQGATQGGYQVGMQGDHRGSEQGGYQGGTSGGQPGVMQERTHGDHPEGTPSGRPKSIPSDQPIIMPERIHGGHQVGAPGGQPVVMPGHFQPQDRFRRDHDQRDHHHRDHFRRDHDHYPGYWPGYWSGGYVVFESWPWGYGPGFPIGLPIAGFLNPPSNLAVVSGYPCTIQWNDNSNNEAGFDIYVGGSCANCAATNNWNLVARVGANVQTYKWVERLGESQRPVNCCDVGECSCVMVRAVKADGSESGNSNVVMLSPVC